MKRIFLTILTVACLASCSDQQTESIVNSEIGISNLNDLEETQTVLKTFMDTLQTDEKSLINEGTEFGTKVSLYKELIDLFDPDNFSCGCDDKIKKALKKIKPKNQKINGFIPDLVLKNAFLSDSVLILDNSGSSILAHLFQYNTKAGVKSKPLFARNAITTQNFNEANFIEKNPRTYDNFLYTLDCTGFLTAAVSAAGGVNSNSVKTSASAATNSNKSLFVIGGVMYSPIYQAFKGEGIFSDNDNSTISRRINVLNAILTEIPSNEITDSTELYLNSNYRVIITSNSGTSSFNGEASFGVTGGVSFGFGSVSGSASGNGSMDRKSEFTRYKTYVVTKNVDAEVPIIYVKDIKQLINSLQATNINT